MKTLPPKLTAPRPVIVTREIRSQESPEMPLLQAPRLSGWRLFFLGLVALSLISILIARLLYLQHFRHRDFAMQSLDNRLRIIPISPHRGIIYDRRGLVLASARQTYTASIYPMKLQPVQIQAVAKQLGKILAVPPADIEARVRQAGIDSPYPVRLKRNLSQAEVAAVMEHGWELPGVSVDPDISRLYPRHDFLAHLLGYTGEVTDDELADNSGYRLGDIVGKMGVEKSYDRVLRGKPGHQFVEVDARGRPRRIIERTAPQRGHDLLLTIDVGIQQAAEEVLGNQRGAIVVLNPFSGEILALASKPDFNPNLFSRPIDPLEWEVLQHRDHPFLNRALSAYPPGSIFKIVPSAAALNEGYIHENTVFISSGSYKVGNRVFYDHGVWGRVNIVDALIHSIDTVYYELAVKMGRRPIDTYSAFFNLGKFTGVDLPSEVRGTIPTRAWKKHYLKEEWFTGDTVNMSIGQGFVQMTPLQAAVMIAAVANGGDVFRPRVVKQILGPDGQVVKQFHPERLRHIPLSPETLHALRTGLRLAVTGGTASSANSSRITVAGKTGTAEDPPRRRPHAWFICYAPVEAPRFSIAVFLEQGGAGGGNAAPLARRILDTVLERVERARTSPSPTGSPFPIQAKTQEGLETR